MRRKDKDGLRTAEPLSYLWQKQEPKKFGMSSFSSPPPPLSLPWDNTLAQSTGSRKRKKILLWCQTEKCIPLPPGVKLIKTYYYSCHTETYLWAHNRFLLKSVDAQTHLFICCRRKARWQRVHCLVQTWALVSSKGRHQCCPIGWANRCHSHALLVRIGLHFTAALDANTDRDVFDCAMGGMNSSTECARRAVNIFELPMLHLYRYKHLFLFLYFFICGWLRPLALLNIRVIVSCLILWTYVLYKVQW